MRDLLERLVDTWTRPRRVALLLAVTAAVLVFAIGEGVFPYYTSNHDEAVYLQQAAMLLEGQLYLHPPAVEPFRPWFFVVDGDAMYPKYTPVTAAIFALGKLAGNFRYALAGVAAATVALTYAVVAEVFDRETGVVAATLLLLSPLFLVDGSVFLPYVPALCLNLLFAWAYLRADRTGSRRFAALAGGTIALSVFARPYTAVLFATPFVLHALWTMRDLDRPAVVRQGLTAALGLCGVAVALGYNQLMTGDPFVFPYQAFAPNDGLGFGRHEILGYDRNYTVSLALEANARNLAKYVTQWTVAGPLGSLLAVTGLGVAFRREDWRPDGRVLALAGVAATVVLGNVYFWGTLNVLGRLADPSDGLISFLGPYYHVSLLLPTVAFAAVGARRVVAAVRERRRSLDSAWARRATLAVAVAVAVVATGVTAGAVVAPLNENYGVTENYETAYEPFEKTDFEHALVFLPDPYGDWLNHPFQALRNDPGYDGDAVYALHEREFVAIDAFPNRTLYRYTFRGDWVPYTEGAVEPRLRQLRLVEDESVQLHLRLGVPPAAERVSVRASFGERGDATASSLPRDGIDATVTIANGTARVTSPHFARNLTVPRRGDEPFELVAYVGYGSLGGFEYDVRLPLDRTATGYRALSPYLEVCRVPRLCGGEAAYVPGTHRTGVSMNATLEP